MFTAGTFLRSTDAGQALSPSRKVGLFRSCTCEINTDCTQASDSASSQAANMYNVNARSALRYAYSPPASRICAAS